MSDDLSRRTILALTALLPLAASAACAEPAGTKASGRPGAKRLVVFFTRSGNTKVIAGTVHRALATDLYEIKAAQPYPEDYDATVARAHQETQANVEPALAERAPVIAAYDTIFLGLPIWGGTAPPIIRSFLKMHEWNGKVIQPFITHGGYGAGDAMSVIKSYAAGALVRAPFVMQADQERHTIDEVRGWLGQIGQA